MTNTNISTTKIFILLTLAFVLGVCVGAWLLRPTLDTDPDDTEPKQEGWRFYPSADFREDKTGTEG